MRKEKCSICKKIINNGDMAIRTPNIIFELTDSRYLCSKKCMNIFKVTHSEIEEGVKRLQNMVRWRR